MIDLTVHPAVLARNLDRVRERGIVIPTLAQMKDPDLVPKVIRDRLRAIGLWDVDPLNLFRINWKNEPIESGGLFGPVNWLEVPPAISGTKARILALVGKWFPTGAHKVGATFACLVPRLVTGQFDAAQQKAVWPSTGNYCRGGAYNSAILGCQSIAILPEEMSRERFDWLATMAGEVIATPGGESNVKEIFDKCHELSATRDNLAIFNQFDEFGNHLWHYDVTGHALREAFEQAARPADRLAAFVSQTGSAGTIGAGDYLKERDPAVRVAAGEALQCPTLLNNGFGAHLIEGIGDKHVPWIHNVRGTDLVIAADDRDCMALIRLFNEPEGQHLLRSEGVPDAFLEKLPLFGISGIGNLLCSIKLAKYYDLGPRDVVMTILTDSMALYGTRLVELAERYGPYTEKDAVRDFHRRLAAQSTANLLELRHTDKKRIHNLKYFTWVEQQGKSVRDLDRMWDEYPEFWADLHGQVEVIDDLINEFNHAAGVLHDLQSPS